MAEAYSYSREGVLGPNGEDMGTALFRRARPSAGGVAVGAGGARGGVAATGIPAADEWEFRGTRGRIQNYERSAAGRMGARNPVERTGQYSRSERERQRRIRQNRA